MKLKQAVPKSNNISKNSSNSKSNNNSERNSRLKCSDSAISHNTSENNGQYKNKHNDMGSQKSKNNFDNRKKEKRKYPVMGSLVWALKKLWRLDKTVLLFALAGVPIAVIKPLFDSYFSKELIDRIGAGAAFSELVIVIILFLGGRFLIEQSNLFFRLRCNGRRYYPTAVYQCEMSAINDYQTAYENTEKQEYKELYGYARRDANHGDCSLEFLWQDLSQGLIHLTGLVTYASFMILLNPIIFSVVVLTSVFTYFTSRWQPAYYEKNKPQWEKEIRKKDYLQGFSEDFSLAKDIKLYGLEEWLYRMMQDYQAYIRMWNGRCRLRGLWASVLSGLMSFLQNGAAYLVLIGILWEGGITVGEFVFYFGLVGSIGGFLQGLIGDMAKLNVRGDKIAYYREFYDYPSGLNYGAGCGLPADNITIELKDIWYRYDGAKEDTLKGINLVIEGGEKLALVGLNGAGKTTLVKLICGFYRPTRGEILVGGRRIHEYNIEEYYSLISAVFQEIRPLAFTCFEFVASADLERPDAREAAADAMKAAGIYDKVMSLSNGMDTHLMKGIYDDGVDFSGGELQKLVLARAIYKDGPILVLDEPTAALDPIAENALYLQYQSLTKGKTSIYISHRFASTRFCDRILLLEDGVITESGTHEELMGKQGRYAYLFETQSKYYKEGELHA